MSDRPTPGHDDKPSPTFWPTGPNNREATGPIGDGTPHARMLWFWDRMHGHEKLIEELTDWHPLSSKCPFEVAIAEAFDVLATGRARSQVLERLLDHFDRYASIEDGTPYAGSPFEAEVKAALALGLPDEEGEGWESIPKTVPSRRAFVDGAAPPPRGAAVEQNAVKAVRGLTRTLEPFVGWNQVDAETAARAAVAHLRHAGLLSSVRDVTGEGDG